MKILMMKIKLDMQMFSIKKINTLKNHKEKEKYILIAKNKTKIQLNLSYLNNTAVTCVQKHHKISDTIAKYVKITIYVPNVIFQNVTHNMNIKQMILNKSTK